MGWRAFRTPEVALSLEGGFNFQYAFRDLMEATGSRDGREVLLALDAVRNESGLGRTPDGKYQIKGDAKP